MIKVDTNKCLYCGGCVSVCPTGALELKETKIIWNKDKCINCGACTKFCPVGALSEL